MNKDWNYILIKKIPMIIKYTIYSDVYDCIGKINNHLVIETELAVNDKTAQHM